MPKKLESLTKTKVSSKAVILGVTAATIIGLSFILSTLVPQVGNGKFYASGDINLPPPPPLGCCEWRDTTYETQSTCKTKSHYEGWWPLDQSEPDSSAGVVQGAACKIKCPSGTTTCGDFCCGSNYTCVSNPVKYCKPTTCTAPRTQLCTAGNDSGCCLPAPQETCGVVTKGVWPASYKYVVCIPQAPPAGCSSSTPGYCGKDDKGTPICCGTGTHCKNDVLPSCVPNDQNSCQPGTIFCPGTGKYSDYARCCPGTSSSVCGVDPKGTPFCK